MASARMVMDSLAADLRALLAAQNIPRVVVATGWPPEQVLQAIPKQDAHGNFGNSILTVYDRKFSKDVTRWPAFAVSNVHHETTLSSNAPLVLDPSDTKTYILATDGGPIVGDAVSLMVWRGRQVAAVVAVADASSTMDSIVADLAAQVAAHAVLSQWLSAAAGPSSLALTNLTGDLLQVQSFAGAYDETEYEGHRTERSLQVVFWGATEALRGQVTNLVESRLAQLQSQFGIAMPNGQAAKIVLSGDAYIEDELLRDVYRRDFLVAAEYGVTYKEYLYEVLAPIETFSTDFP